MTKMDYLDKSIEYNELESYFDTLKSVKAKELKDAGFDVWYIKGFERGVDFIKDEIHKLGVLEFEKYKELDNG